MLEFLGLPPELADGTHPGDLLIHAEAAEAVSAAYGLPVRCEGLRVREFTQGPRSAIRVVWAELQAAGHDLSYVTPAFGPAMAQQGPESGPNGYVVASHSQKLAQLRAENAFVRTMMGIILWATFTALALVAGAPALFGARSRLSGFPILHVIGLPKRSVLSGALVDSGAAVLAGCALGAASGWAAGYYLISVVVPEGLKPFWHAEATALTVLFPLLLLLVVFIVAVKAVASEEPVQVIERAEDVI